MQQFLCLIAAEGNFDEEFCFLFLPFLFLVFRFLFYFLIINKQANLASHPSRKHQVDNIISMIASYYQKNNIKANVHIATRLDYLTTGIMIVAKSGLIHQMMEKTKTTKIYTCKIKGQLNPSSGLIDLPIKRLNPYDIRRWVDKDGLRALTKYHTIASDEAFSIV